MNIEEAKANIGKEVMLDESTKPYKNGTLILDIKSNDFVKGVLLDVGHYSIAKVDTLDGFHLFINIKHLKLKEQPMQNTANYKIKVTPETSEEVQKLFFELGYEWINGGKTYFHPLMHTIFANINGLFFRDKTGLSPKGEYQEITLPQLRDLVVLKRNDVGDATHRGGSGLKFYFGDKEYVFQNDNWLETSINDYSQISTIKKKPQMTWPDALRAVADGKDVEVFDCNYWIDVAVVCIEHLQELNIFRIKPQTVTFEARPYTKEELLKIVGEMK